MGKLLVELVLEKPITKEQANFIYKYILDDYNRDECMFYSQDEVMTIDVKIIDKGFFDKWEKFGQEQADKTIADYISRMEPAQLEELNNPSPKKDGLFASYHGSFILESVRNLRKPDIFKRYLFSRHQWDIAYAGKYVLELTVKDPKVANELYNKFESILDSYKVFTNIY